MRFGGHVFEDSTPEAWIAEIKRCNYSAAFSPVSINDSDERIRSFAQAAADAHIVIAGTGAWSNPLSDNEEEKKQALENCKRNLELAERIGARCCVNIAGSRGEHWYGPHPDNFSSETFEMIVDTVREIIDAVQPQRAFYALEAMPWIFPDSPDTYLSLFNAIERPQFGIHLDPVNMINSPRRYFDNAEFLRECFAKLGPWIKSCHAKDITLGPDFMVHLTEVRPGLGALDYRTFLKELSALDDDIPLMMEHLATPEEYALAAGHIRSVAAEAGVTIS